MTDEKRIVGVLRLRQKLGVLLSEFLDLTPQPKSPALPRAWREPYRVLQNAFDGFCEFVDDLAENGEAAANELPKPAEAKGELGKLTHDEAIVGAARLQHKISHLQVELTALYEGHASLLGLKGDDRMPGEWIEVQGAIEEAYQQACGLVDRVSSGMDFGQDEE